MVVPPAIFPMALCLLQPGNPMYPSGTTHSYKPTGSGVFHSIILSMASGAGASIPTVPPEQDHRIPSVHLLGQAIRDQKSLQAPLHTHFLPAPEHQNRLCLPALHLTSFLEQTIRDPSHLRVAAFQSYHQVHKAIRTRSCHLVLNHYRFIRQASLPCNL